MDLSISSRSPEVVNVTRVGNRASRKAARNTSLIAKSIRCDKTSPCSSCRIASLPCGVASATTTGEGCSDVASADSPEKTNFSAIHENLAEIKKQLAKLEQRQQSHQLPFEVCVVNTERTTELVPNTPYQNEPSFNSQSAQASLSAELSAGEANSTSINQEIQSSLASLKLLLQRQNKPSPVNDIYFPCSSTRLLTESIDLPPVSVVIAALKKATVKVPPVILHNGFRDHLMLENLCKKVYFPVSPPSKGEVILVNGLLFYLLDAYSKEGDPALSSSDCAMYAKLCEKNFCNGIQDYEFLVTPTLENIQCLMMGGDARPSLCWTLVSGGARLCQSLGYHREAEVARGPPEQADAKRHIFWMLYMIDKVMSLYLGRASSFPDYDIDVEIFPPNQDSRFWAWDKVLIGFIELCRLQGQMYEELYSVRARRELPETRLRMIEERVSSLFAWHVSLKKIATEHSQDKRDLDLIISWSDFFYYYILTLLYGAKTSSDAATHISSQRYKAARLGLLCHMQNCAELSSSKTPGMRVYSGWILLFSSFSHFIVVFTHSIASHSQDDVELLSQVLRTLEEGRSISAATNRLYELCKVFLRFATAFIQSTQTFLGSYNKEDDSFTFPIMGTDSTSQYYNAIQFSSGNTCETMYDDLLPMSAFLGACLGENQAMSGLWNIDFPHPEPI
ncbi:fungal-specific transcription factor domain-containing protein [Bisporella sp. PMI_857]|nr:fungal-specific transcription factor domain-containing protein [Bisporella sp. PMI_857]